MQKDRITTVFLLLLFGSILMIANGALIASSGQNIVLSSATPSIVRFNDWESFRTSASNTSRVTYLHQEPEATIILEAVKATNVSSAVTEQTILSYNGVFPGNITQRHDPIRLESWITDQLKIVNISNTTISSNKLLSVESIKRAPFWGRIALGTPGMVENGMAYVWLLTSVAVLAFAVMIYSKPMRQKTLAPWIIVFSLLSIPIGGGFIIGAIVGLIAGLGALEWPKSYGETFLGTILNIARLDSKAITGIAQDSTKLRTAAITVVFVGILSSVGAGLYALNVNMIYSSNAITGLRSAYRIMVMGATLTGIEIWFGATASVAVSILKWFILSAIVYVIGAKFQGSKMEFASMAAVLGFVYVPEILQLFTPMLVLGEPYMSRGIGIGIIPIPVSWPLALFYISRIWAFGILMVAVSTLTGLSRLKALGIASFAGTLYVLLEYVFIYPQLNLPGLRIVFSESTTAILIVASCVIALAMLLGVFKREKGEV